MPILIDYLYMSMCGLYLKYQVIQTQQHRMLLLRLHMVLPSLHMALLSQRTVHLSQRTALLSQRTALLSPLMVLLSQHMVLLNLRMVLLNLRMVLLSLHMVHSSLRTVSLLFLLDLQYHPHQASLIHSNKQLILVTDNHTLNRVHISLNSLHRVPTSLNSLSRVLISLNSLFLGHPIPHLEEEHHLCPEEGHHHHLQVEDMLLKLVYMLEMLLRMPQIIGKCNQLWGHKLQQTVQTLPLNMPLETVLYREVLVLASEKWETA